MFQMCDLPDNWDTSEEYTNLTEDMLQQCRASVAHQQRFDKKLLASALCYRCGKVLWSSVDGAHTFLVHPPEGMREKDAPASAIIHPVPDCALTFLYSDRERWYACSHCRSNTIPSDQYVGDVTSANGELKPVSEWSTEKPQPVAALRNKYETGQVALCGLFSTTVKEANVWQWKHVQGEVNSIHKLDRHYYGLFGFLACKDTSFAEHSANPRVFSQDPQVTHNNYLYSSFFSQYETLFRYVKPKFVNPQLLEKQAMSLDQLLQDEAVGIAFPIDATYFDQFPLIYDCEDVAGVQHPHYPHGDCQKDLQDLTAAKYGEKFLEPKTFPHLHPWGYGGWHYGCPLNFQAHVKTRLFDVRGWWVTDPCYAFFKYDYMTKMREVHVV